MNDLDTSRFLTEVETPVTMSILSSAGGLARAFGHASELDREVIDPYKPEPTTPKTAADSLSPAEAVQHMRDVARLLQNWRSGLGHPPDTQAS